MAKFFGVGVGPGDPELLTLKAYRAIRSSPVVSYIANERGESQARHIARLAFEQNAIEPAVQKQQEIPVPMPMCNDRSVANAAYDAAAEQIIEQLSQGRDVVFLCEGDPLFFGSFSYLLQRIEGQFPCEVIPGITSVNAASATIKLPLTMLQESFAVLSGRHSAEQLESALISHDSVVIMKAGISRPKILEALGRSNRLNEAQYLENIGRETQQVTPANQLESCEGPYFSLFVVTRSNRPA